MFVVTSEIQKELRRFIAKEIIARLGSTETIADIFEVVWEDLNLDDEVYGNDQNDEILTEAANKVYASISDSLIGILNAHIALAS